MRHKRSGHWLLPALLTSLTLAACDEQAPPPAASPPGPTPEQILNERIARDPSDLDARLALANLLFDTFRRPQAIPLYQEVLDKRGDDPNIRTDLATCLLDAGRHAEARTEYGRVILARPDHVNAIFNLAVLENTDGNPAEAARLWEKAASTTSDRRIADQAMQLAAEARRRAESGKAP